jgi:hypothetical protein
MANPGMPEKRPRLVRGGADAGRTPATGAPEVRSRRRGPALAFVLAALAAVALGAALLQTERLDRVTAQADALRAANQELEARIEGYEQQRALIRESVADLAARVAALGEIVRADGEEAEMAPAATAEPAFEPPPPPVR